MQRVGVGFVAIVLVATAQVVVAERSAPPAGATVVDDYRSVVEAAEPDAWYQFEDGSSGTAADAAGSAHGTYNGTRVATDGPFGAIGDAIELDGPADSLSLPPFVDGPITVEVWARPDSQLHELQRIVRRRTYGFHLDYDSTAGAFTAGAHLKRADNVVWGYPSVISHPVEPGVWHHVVLTISATRLTLFVDGAEADRFSYAGPLTPYYTGVEATVGNDVPGGQSAAFYGGLDELAVYPRAR